MQDVPTLSPKTRPNKPKASVHALELQRLLMTKAREEDVPGSVLAQISRAWVDLQEMRLRLAMKPAPKPIDVSLLKSQKPQAKGPRVQVGKPPADIPSAPVSSDPNKLQ